jgi:hypothetical protein
MYKSYVLVLENFEFVSCLELVLGRSILWYMGDIIKSCIWCLHEMEYVNTMFLYLCM